MAKWSGGSKGKVMFNENLFSFNILFKESIKLILFNWIKEICEYKLQVYFERKEGR